MIATRLFATALAALSLAACGGGGDDTTKTATPKIEVDGAEAVPAAGADGGALATKPFKMKSGVVEMTMDMMGPQKQTMYFDDYGAKQAVVTDIEIMGQKNQSVTINADGYTYSYDPAKKEGTKMKIPAGAPGVGGVPNLDDLTDAMKAQYKLKEIDGRSIAGKDAKGYEMEAMGMPMKVWVWEGIPMRTEVSMGEKPMVLEVSNVQTDVDVPADRFTVPADIKLSEK